MKLSSLNAFQMGSFLANLQTLLGGAALSSIDAAVRADLLTAMGTLAADITAAANDAEVQKNQAEASVAARDVLVAQALPIGRSARSFLEAGNAPKEQYDLCGFDYPDATRTTYVAQTPSGLVVTAFSPASVKGKFKGNNSSGSILYEIWRRQGDTGPWGLQTAVKTTSFIETGLTPGQYYEYRVRAKAAKTVSEFSASAVVYGVN